MPCKPLTLCHAHSTLIPACAFRLLRNQDFVSLGGVLGWRSPSWGGRSGCLLSEHSPRHLSQTGLEHLPVPLMGYLPPPSRHQLGAASERPTALPSLLPGHCFDHRGPVVHVLQQLPSQIPPPEPPGYQCQDEKHYKLTINRGRRGEAAKE